jgi:hypothetical protein
VLQPIHEVAHYTDNRTNDKFAFVFLPSH